jgi:DNA-binding Lrp family transcriptional regulator
VIVFVIAEVEVGREKEVSRALAMVTGVTEVYVLTGEYDVLVKINVDKPEEALDLIMDKIRKISGIEGTRTIFAKKVK